MDASTIAVIAAPLLVVAGVGAWGAYRGLCWYLSDLDNLV